MSEIGRPKIDLNFELIEKLSRIHCTEAEIASIVGVSIRTLQRNEEFCRIYKKGIDSGKMSLRRIQWDLANKGNTTMAIWLGKQYLGQTDKQELSGSGDNPIIVKFKDG
jgi:hypothetical protein